MIEPGALASIPSEAYAKAADFGSKALDVAGRLGGWLGEVIGDVPKDMVGRFGGDALHYSRLVNLESLKVALDAKLEKIAAERRTNASASIVLPLMESARDESRPVLQELWAALLANASIDHGVKVRAVFIDVAKKMEPTDARVLALVADRPRWNLPGMMHLSNMQRLQQLLNSKGLSEDEFEVSYAALGQLNLVGDTTVLTLTAFGRQFLAACTVD